MKLNKQIPYKWVDEFGVEKVGTVEIQVKSWRLLTQELDTSVIIKLLCISTKCSFNCKECCLKSEDTFKDYMKGIDNGDNRD